MRGRAAPPHPGIYRVPPRVGLVTILIKLREARNVWKETPTRHFCSSLLFIENSLAYYLNCHAAYRNFSRCLILLK